MAQHDRVVILGGTGFIGWHLIERLKGKVSSLRVVSRSAGSGAGQDGCEYVAGDVYDAERMAEVLTGASVVFHLAMTMDDDGGVGARNVARACLQRNVRRLVFTSTTDALFLGRNGRVDESDGPDAKPEQRNPYSRGKVASERALLELHAAEGLPIVIVRPGLVVGKGGRLAHGGLGEWKTPTGLLGWGSGRNPLPFVLVHDVAAALDLAMDAPGIEGMAFNLCGDVFLSARDYLRLVGDRTLREFRFHSRNLPLHYGVMLGKTAAKRLLGRSFEHQTYRDLVSQAMYAAIDNTAAKEKLGWRPNGDIDVFIHNAIDCHAEPIRPGDLRLPPPS